MQGRRGNHDGLDSRIGNGRLEAHNGNAVCVSDCVGVAPVDESGKSPEFGKVADNVAAPRAAANDNDPRSAAGMFFLFQLTASPSRAIVENGGAVAAVQRVVAA